ncbi:hypothetical protein KAS31_00205 [Candidatus Parcubacteria bacterium]|nr:hypothetical protein [Candidatus Parcubacteria bacterium]MCK5085613.1 hypothetical protein [Candidatus Parcubacteria bacterium]
MDIETPPSEPIINEQGKEALQDLKLVLEAKRIPEDERQGYIDRLTNKINGETNEDMIDLVQANIAKDVMERAKEMKFEKSDSEAESREKACANCGTPNPSSANFCGECGNKY